MHLYSGMCMCSEVYLCFVQWKSVIKMSLKFEFGAPGRMCIRKIHLLNTFARLLCMYACTCVGM